MHYGVKALLTLSMENFVRRAYFCFLKQSFERTIKNFQRRSKKQKKKKNARRTKFFTLRENKIYSQIDIGTYYWRRNCPSQFAEPLGKGAVKRSGVKVFFSRAQQRNHKKNLRQNCSCGIFSFVTGIDPTDYAQICRAKFRSKIKIKKSTQILKSKFVKQCAKVASC